MAESTQLKILVAEDDADIRGLLTYRLGRAGHEVVAASNGVEAWELYQEESPDMLVLDLMMPMMTGLEVVKLVRERGDQVPILLLTASVQEEHMSGGFEAGVDDFMRKPFNPQELLNRITALSRR